jgi:signal transduction histidine kinase/ActR/RegA family two-component response regulator
MNPQFGSRTRTAPAETIDPQAEGTRGLFSILLSRPLLVLIPIATLFSVAGLIMISRLAEQRIAEQLRSGLDSTAFTLVHWAADRQSNALVQTRQSAVRGLIDQLRLEQDADVVTETASAACESLRREMEVFCRAYGYTSFFVSDLRGAVLAAPGTDSLSGYVPTPGAVVWERLQAGEAALLPLVRCPISLAGLDGEPLQGQPILMIAAPVMNEADEEPVAILYLTQSPDQGFSQILEVGRLGKTGETYAFNSDGVMLSNSRFEQDLSRMGLLPAGEDQSAALRVMVKDPEVNLMSHPSAPVRAVEDRPLTPMCARAILGGEGLDTWGYNDYRGVPVVGAWRWFPDYSFGIAFEMDVAEAYASARTTYLVFGLLVVPILVGAGVSEWNAARSRQSECRQSLLLGQLEQQATQLEARNNQLRDAYRSANAANEAKSLFLANMSHEIRTPLNSVLGFVDILRVEGETLDRATQVELLDIVHRSGTHLLGLINDILDLSKIEAGKLQTDLLPMSVVELLEEISSTMGVKAREKGLALRLVYETELPSRIVTDAQRLKQVLINLVGNAIKFTHQGHVTIHVAAPSRAGQGLIEFRIEDTGCGISPAGLAKLFQPFSQADGSVTRQFGGTGLGLTISKQLCEALGGTVTVQSEEKVGSCFTATVAMGDIAGVPWSVPRRETVRDRSADAPIESPLLQGCRILVVDDGDTNRQLLRLFLNRTGCEVFEAVDGLAALREVRGVRPDAILMDMQMPRLDGYATSRRLRAAGYRGAVVACSADAMRENIARMKSCGCDAFVPKPIEYAVLIEQLEIALIQRGFSGSNGRIEQTTGAVGPLDSIALIDTAGESEPELAVSSVDAPG